MVREDIAYILSSNTENIDELSGALKVADEILKLPEIQAIQVQAPAIRQPDKEENFIHDKYGYCYYTIGDENAIIYNLFTEPEYRGRGYAHQRLSYIIEQIRVAGYSGKIDIEIKPMDDTTDPEKLKKFYNRIGLNVVAV